MAKQLTDKNFYPGGYVDDSMSVNTITDLKSLTRSRKFVGLTVTVLNAITNNNNEPIPADFWLSETRNTWVLKNIAPIDTLDAISNIPEEYIPIGFEITLKNGEKYHYTLSDDEKPIWVLSIKNEEIKDLISDTVQDAINKVTSGASDAFDTLKEIEDWIKENSGSTGSPGADGITPKFKIDNDYWFVSYDEGETWKELGKATGEQGEKGALDEEQIISLKDEIKSYTDEEISKIQIPSLDGVATEEWVNQQGFIKEHQDISHLATSADVVSAIQNIEEKIPSLEGYATETFVKNAIADAQLSGDTQIDLSGYATKDDIKNLASKDDIKVYSSGTGVSIVDNKINVLIETGDTENRNYIKVNEDNSLSVEEIGLDDAVTTEDIQVNGGAWASAIQDIYGDTIPVGTSFQDFLKAMSCKEYFVSAITVSSSFTVSCGELKPGLSGANSGDIVEVGTEVILGTINGNETKARQSLTLSGFEYGYKIGENGNHINSKTYTQIPIPVASGETGNKTLRVTFNNFVSSITGGSISVKTGQTLIDKTTMYVQEGQNSVHIYQTGDTYSSNTNLTGGTFYISTNLKNYYKSDKLTPNIYVPIFPLISKTATASTTYSITGARKYYIGDIKDYSADYWNTDKNSVVLNLEIQDWATGNTITVPHTFKIGTKQQTVVVPAAYTNVSGKDANSGSVEFGLIKTITLTNSKGSKSQYNVFVAPAYDGLNTDSLINITIKKS